MRKVMQPIKQLHGDMTLPGDKSISHRALILGALCEGDVRVENLSPGHDVKSTLTCLLSLGVNIAVAPNLVVVHGNGLNSFQKPVDLLDAGNSGTTMRLLSAILAAQPFVSTVTGDESLRKREMRRVIEPLSQMGGKIESNKGFAPLTITGGALKGIEYRLPVASAQVKSALLLAGLYASGTTSIVEVTPTRDHTERMMDYFGVSLDKIGDKLTLHSGQRLRGSDLFIPGDLSSALFFIAAAMLVQDAKLAIRNVGVNPTRSKILDILKEMGGEVKLENLKEVNREPRADLAVISSRLRGVEIGGKVVANLIDELPMLAVMATQAHGMTTIKDAGELRVKESDRIQTTVTNLQKMGANVEELGDGMRIQGPVKLKGAQLDTFHDHRIAMAFAVAGLVAEGDTTLEGAEWADISFPGFFETLESLSR